MFTGLLTALVTPFSSDASLLDEKALEVLIDFQLTGGVSGLVILGTTGEAPTISYHEKKLLIQSVVSNVAGRTKIVVGTGTNCTKTSIRLSQEAQSLGADGLLVVCPYYNKPTQQGLYDHFTAIAQSVDIPIILYNVPGRTGVNLEAETVIRLSRHPNIRSVKEASGNINQIRYLCEYFKDNPEFTVLSGDDGITDQVMHMGGDGVISVVSNILPAEMSQWVEALRSSHQTEASRLRKILEPYFTACFVQTNPIPIKTMLSAKGLCKDTFRLPLTPMTALDKQQLLQSVS